METSFIIGRMKKCKETADELQENLKKLRDLADGLENMHRGTTIGSLSGGVIGATGGITSIFGMILAPFTLGVSLVVTGVGIGMAVAGGVTAGASNITNMVKQSNARQDVRCIIKEIEEKVRAVMTWLKEIDEALQKLKESIESAENRVSPEIAGLVLTVESLIVDILDMDLLITAVKTWKIAVQTTRAFKVAEAFSGVLSVMFLAVDAYFIAMDSIELNNINEANVKSETMKFVMSIRQNVDILQKFLDKINCASKMLDSRMG